MVRRHFNVRDLVLVHEVSGQYLSLVGTMYAVLLGLIVVDAMSRFQQAITAVEEEASSPSTLIFLAGRMPSAQRSVVQERALTYAQLVIDREWEAMRHARDLPEARAVAVDLMRLSRDWEPVTESEKAVYSSVLPAAANFWNARRVRIIACERHIPVLEWCVVILGGIVTVALTYLFVFDDLRIQITLTAMVALLIALNVFLVLMFGYPFSGDLCVSPDGFRVALAAVTLGTPIASS